MVVIDVDSNVPDPPDLWTSQDSTKGGDPVLPEEPPKVLDEEGSERQGLGGDVARDEIPRSNAECVYNLEDWR